MSELVRTPRGSLKHLTAEERKERLKIYRAAWKATNRDKVAAFQARRGRDHTHLAEDGILTRRHLNADMTTDDVRTIRAIDTAVRQEGGCLFGHGGAAGLGDGSYWKRAKHLAW